MAEERDSTPQSHLHFSVASQRGEPPALKVSADCKKLLQDIHDRPARLLTKFEKSVEDKIRRNRNSLGTRPSFASPRTQRLRDKLQLQSSQNEGYDVVDESDFVKAFELKEEVSSLQQVLVDFVFLHRISTAWRESLFMQRQRSFAEESHPSQIDTSNDKLVIQALTIQRWYRKLRDLKHRHTSTTIIAAFLQALKQSYWCKLRVFRCVIKKCQRIVRSFLACTSARLHALNVKWQNLQNAAISKKSRQFIPKTTRYYLLLEWLRKARKLFVVSSLRYEQAMKTGVTSFTAVDEQQVRRFLHAPRSGGTKRLSMQIPQLVVSVDESLQRPCFLVYSRDMLDEDVKHMIQRALRLTPKDLPSKDLHVLPLFLPEMRKTQLLTEVEVVHRGIAESSLRTKTKKSASRDQQDTLGGSRTEVARLIRAVNKLVLSHKSPR